MLKSTDTLKHAIKRIQVYFSQNASRVYTEYELRAILKYKRAEWKIAPWTLGSRFVEFLLSNEILRETRVESESYPAKRRFTREDATPYQVALSLAADTYLTHSTAVFLHGLTDQIPKTIYVNREQRPKAASSACLTQGRIDLAFSGRQRTSKYVFRIASHRIVVLSGKHTGRLEVESVDGPSGELLQATSIARTLVDITVRSGYAGGVSQVLEAYRGARGRIAGERLLGVLKELDYVYPYHQSIGFLLEKAAWAEEDIKPFRTLEMKFDFYLLHGMREREYDQRWRLFYPKGL